MFNRMQSDYVVSFSYIMEEHYIFPKSIMDSAQSVYFEGHSLPIMKEYDKYLTIMFGEYMEMPPIEKRKYHKILDVDLGDDNG